MVSAIKSVSFSAGYPLRAGRGHRRLPRRGARPPHPPHRRRARRARARAAAEELPPTPAEELPPIPAEELPPTPQDRLQFVLDSIARGLAEGSDGEAQRLVDQLPFTAVGSVLSTSDKRRANCE